MRVLPYFLMPQGIALIVLAFFTHAVGVPVYLVAMGISSGIIVTITTALLIEMYSLNQIAQVRSSVEAANIQKSHASCELFSTDSIMIRSLSKLKIE